MLHDAPQTVTEDAAHAGHGPDRRRVMMLSAAATLGAAGVAAMAGCGSDSGSAATTSEGAGTSAAASGAGAAGSGGVLAKLSDVPVGGSYAASGPDGKPIVISQPQAGSVVAFSATCTHKGCKVAPKDTVLSCPCHQSTFDAFTGKNLSGPAPSPLPTVAVKVSGTDVVAG